LLNVVGEVEAVVAEVDGLQVTEVARRVQEALAALLCLVLKAGLLEEVERTDQERVVLAATSSAEVLVQEPPTV
jgi:hypothetical protein